MYYHNYQVLEIIKFYYLQECIDFEIRQKKYVILFLYIDHLASPKIFLRLSADNIE